MNLPAPSAKFLLSLWLKFKKIPGGNFIFQKALAAAIPYSATIHPIVLELEPGFAKIKIKDQRSVRNHLNSIHAIALANLAELTSGLALNTGLPDNTRAILKDFHILYKKKGRGTLIAESRVELPATNNKAEWRVEVLTKNKNGDLITEAVALWQIGPDKLQ